jgi:hypothetical protein
VPHMHGAQQSPCHHAPWIAAVPALCDLCTDDGYAALTL